MTRSLSRFVRSIAVALIALAGSATGLRAQGTSLVASSDLVYADIDRLSELGLLDSVIIGQRPYSRREIARIARVAREHLDTRRRDGAHPIDADINADGERLLRRIEARFAGTPPAGGDIIVAPIDGSSLVLSSTSAERRGFPADYSKVTEATIDPLAERRLGQPAVRGQTAALELSNRIEPTDWLAFQARERVELRNPSDGSLGSTDGEILLASMRARLRNVALTVGRQQFTWAQDQGDGLFLASDAPALDQVSLSGDHPFILPGMLSALGPTQLTVIAADLGASISRSHSKLLTYKLSVQPTSDIELGGTFMDHFGGTGARWSSPLNQLIDFLPFIDVFRKHNYTDSTKTIDVDSDKLLGVDGRWRVPALGGVTLTGELLIDDFDVHRLPKLLTGYGSQTFALIIPEIGSPTVSAKLSVVHMGILTYTHSQLLDGITTRGRLLGNELGPDAKSYSATLSWDASTRMHFALESRTDIYSNAEYTSFYTDSAQTLFVVQKVSNGPNELRDLLLGSLIVRQSDLMSFTARGGLERTRNSFQGGRRNDYVASVGVRIGQ